MSIFFQNKILFQHFIKPLSLFRGSPKRIYLKKFTRSRVPSPPWLKLPPSLINFYSIFEFVNDDK